MFNHFPKLRKPSLRACSCLGQTHERTSQQTKRAVPKHDPVRRLQTIFIMQLQESSLQT